MLKGSKTVNEMTAALRKGSTKNRVKAAIAVARTMDARFIPTLLEALKDKDPAIRAGAAQAIINMISPDRMMNSLIDALKDKNSKVRANAAYALVNVQNRRVEGPLVKALKDKDPRVREKSAFTLGRVPGGLASDSISPSVVKALSELLKDKDPTVKYEAAYSLALFKDIKGIQGLLEQLNDPDKNVRWRAVAGLLMLNDNRCVDGLMGHRNDKDPKVRGMVLEAICQISPERAVNILLEALRDEADAENKVLELLFLDRHDEERVIAVLEKVMLDKNAKVRSMALYVHSKMRPEIARQHLIKDLESKTLRIRWNAVVALLEMQDPEALGPLMKVLLDRKNYKMWFSGGERIEWLGDNITPMLVEALKDKDLKIRRAAAEALGFMRDPTTVGPLLDALKDPDAKVRLFALSSLNRLKDASMVDGLIGALEDKNPKVREAAASTLGQLEDKKAVDGLIKALKDKVSQVRTAAVWALYGLQDPKCVEGLVQVLLEEDDIEVLRSIGPAIESFKDENVIPKLVEAVSRETGRLSDPYVRLAAAQALRGFRRPPVVKALMTALKDQYTEVRMLAIETLAAMHYVGLAEKDILAALQDPNWLVRMRAATALQSSDDKAYIKPLEEALKKEEHGTVRATLVEAIAGIKRGDPTAHIW